MNGDSPDAWVWDTIYDVEGDTMRFETQRAIVEAGRTFSAAAMAATLDQIGLWIGTRVMRRWNATGEPPTVVLVTVTVEVQ